MNWIFEAYANAYGAATMLGRRHDTYAAPAKTTYGKVTRDSADRRQR